MRTARQYSIGLMPVALANRRSSVRRSSPAAVAMAAKGDASSVPHVHPFLSLQYGSISVRQRRSKASKIARLTRCWVGKNKARRLRPYGRAENPVTRNRPRSTHDRNPPAVMMPP
jgi:hypothetical protein